MNFLFFPVWVGSQFSHCRRLGASKIRENGCVRNILPFQKLHKKICFHILSSNTCADCSVICTILKKHLWKFQINAFKLDWDCIVKTFYNNITNCHVKVTSLLSLMLNVKRQVTVLTTPTTLWRVSLKHVIDWISRMSCSDCWFLPATRAACFHFSFTVGSWSVWRGACWVGIVLLQESAGGERWCKTEGVAFRQVQ